MKLLFILTMSVFTCINISIAQTGINTTNPQQTLHLAGSNSTIRIDGLNAINNTGNNGLNNSQLYVDANGDLKVKYNSPIFAANLLGAMLIPSSVLVRTNSGASNTMTLASGNFTISSNAWTNIVYELGALVQEINQTYALNDGAPREIKISLYIDGTEVSNSSTTYLNIDRSGSIAVGLIVLSNSLYQYLNSGTHTYRLTGSVYGGSYGFDAYFGGSPLIDRLQILEFN